MVRVYKVNRVQTVYGAHKVGKVYRVHRVLEFKVLRVLGTEHRA